MVVILKLNQTIKVMKTDNELIAEFMSLRKNDAYSFVMYLKDGVWFDSGSMRYNTSWDWLMPVVTKCWQIAKEKDYCSAYMLADLDFQYVAFGDIEKSYQAVVEFIKSYNDGKTTK
jgi:tetrahydromethanopterin S-methyltransferase subunit H